VIFAKGQILPDTALPEVLAGLEADINATRAALTLEPETVIAAIEALGQKLDSGALDPLLAQFATPKMLAALEDIRPQLTREALEYKLERELGDMLPPQSRFARQLPPEGGAERAENPPSERNLPPPVGGRWPSEARSVGVGEAKIFLSTTLTPSVTAFGGDSSPARGEPRTEITTKLLPLGTLFHVTAGNVAGLPAFSAVEGLLTGNVNLIKLPRADKGLTLAILSQLVKQEPRLTPFLYAFDIPSSDKKTMQALAALADGLVVWGGDEAVRSCRGLAPVGCKLMEWGHRLSFAYIAGFEDMEEELAALARHIVDTGGLLCSSCQVIYLDTDDLKEGERFCLKFLPILERCADIPQPIGQSGQRTLYAYEAWLEHIVDHAQRDAAFFRGAGCSLTLCRDESLELSPLNGNVLVKCLPRAKLLSTLRRERGHLQTAGLLCAPEDRPVLTQLLCRVGLTRITRAGSMSRTFPGENHDGEYSLRRYIRSVDVEI